MLDAEGMMLPLREDVLRTAALPDGIVARTRHDLTRELIDELTVTDAKIRVADKQLRQLVNGHGSTRIRPARDRPVRVARLISDMRRFRTPAHFASGNGTAPLEASSGDQRCHRLSRAGNRRINRALHIAAVVQLRRDTPGLAYYRRRLAERQNHDKSARAPATGFSSFSGRREDLVPSVRS